MGLVGCCYGSARLVGIGELDGDATVVVADVQCLFNVQILITAARGARAPWHVNLPSVQNGQQKVAR